MKKVLKVLIPLLLIVALLTAAIWFFIFYRPDVTNSFLTDQAQAMADRGRYSRAIKYYTWASKLEPERDDIHIGLAETYAASGNFTKAEYTLVKAISTNPKLTELYVSLCRVYVEQGKLLDATQMLDRLSDPDVKAELDAMRPSAPTVVPEGGYYTEYIDVSVSSDTSTVYLTANGEYPSSEDDIYTGPFQLSSGETTVLAIAVSEDGLVSPAVLTGYTVGGVVEAVTLQDPAVDRAVREQLSLSEDAELMSDLLWSITHLVLPDTVADLTDLSRFTSLRSLSINDVSGLDLSVLSSLTSLQELDLSGCTISSDALQAIGSLTHLRKLILNGCALTDITAFSQLTGLTELSLSGNSLDDIGILSLMTELERVDLSRNPLSSIAALSACNKLKYLDISNCSITSLGSLSDKRVLETVLASNNTIRSIDELSGCDALSVLEVKNCLISDISVLTTLPSLTRFDADHNEVTVIPDFNEDDCKLIYFSVNYNQVTDVSGLADIDTLNYLNIDYNAVTDLLPISKNINLIKVNAWDNAITKESVDALAGFEIILNYNPNYEAPEA